MTQTEHSLEEQQAAKVEKRPRLRFAPSPTGFQHIGGYRTALFSWLFARHSGGDFILRIEDTDTARTVEGAVEYLIDGLKWLNMDYDEGPIVGGPYGPYYQTERKALYQHYAHRLIESGHAYYCYCSPERLEQVRREQAAQKLPPRYDRHCRYLTAEQRAEYEAAGIKPTVRFAMPLEGKTVVHDELHGDITFNNADIDDFIILKWHGAPSWIDFQKQGYLPEAVFNFMALLGWSYDDKTEIMTREELIERFTLDRIGVSGGIYDADKLLWMNGYYIRHLPLEEFTRRTIPYMERPEAEGGLPDTVRRPLDFDYTMRVLSLEQERLKTLGEAAHAVSFFYTDTLDYETPLLIQKGMDAGRTLLALTRARDLLNSIEQWEHSVMEQPMRELASELGLKTGQLFGSIRTAVSGRTATPPLFQMMEVLGRERSMQRINEAIARLS